MAVFEWSPAYEIGEPLIDVQHREWFKRVEDLLQAVQGGAGAAEVLKLLEFASEYTTAHFTLEELMLRAARYPSLPEHVEAHHKLSVRVAALLGAARQGDPNAPLEAAQVMTRWITNHIKTADLAYATWLKGLLTAPRDAGTAP